MSNASKILKKLLANESMDARVYRVDMDRVDVTPTRAGGILRSLPITGDREKIKPGDPVKVLNIAGERVVMAADVATDPAQILVPESEISVPAPGTLQVGEGNPFSTARSALIGAGTAFPTEDRFAGDLFFRTDLGFLCYFDGTRWLTTHEYGINSIKWSNVSASQSLASHGIRSDYPLYVTRSVVTVYVTSNNNASNYWQFNVRLVNKQYNWTIDFKIFNTSTYASGTHYHVDTAHNTVTTLANNIGNLDTYVTKVGSPGAMHMSYAMYYRLIIT